MTEETKEETKEVFHRHKRKIIHEDKAGVTQLVIDPPVRLPTSQTELEMLAGKRSLAARSASIDAEQARGQASTRNVVHRDADFVPSFSQTANKIEPK